MKILSVGKSHFLVACTVLMLSLVLIGEVGAATYYVATNGNDSNSGSTSAPFRTIQRAADIVNPGDTVIVRNGTYTDTNGDTKIVYITRGGSAGNMITFKSENKWGAVLDGQETATHGFMMYGASYIRIEDFEIKNVRYTAIHYQKPDSSHPSSNGYVYRNKIHDIGRYYVDPCVNYADADTGRPAIFACDICGPLTIDSNIIYTVGRLPGGACAQYDHFDYNHDHGIYFNSANTTIINNIFYDFKSGWPIQKWQGSDGTVKVVNNTFYGTNPGRDGHILLSGARSNWIIQNNIFHSPKSWAIQGGSSDDTNIVIKNNLVYNADITSTGECDGVKWICSNNITGQDPLFINLTGRDFHLTAYSPAIDKGIGFPGRTLDADGYAIVSTPDIGAYEYVGTQPPPPPAYTDTISPAPPVITQIN